MPLPVEVERRGEARATAYATNLSGSGICLHVAAPLPVGEAVLLRLALPGEPGQVTARGRVSWCEAPPAEAAAKLLEAGVRFEIVSEVDRERIAGFVRASAGAHPGFG